MRHIALVTGLLWRLLPCLLLGTLAACSSYDTPAIQDLQGRPLPHSIASLEQLTLGGVPQWILIRGQDRRKPLLLKLHGGPGQAEMATRPLNRLLEQDFVVVEWDQRGAGKSAVSAEPASGMSLQQLVADTHALTELLLKRFNQRRLILVGHSWGSVVGLHAVQQRPALYQAFVSTGQIANFQQGMRAGHQFLLAEAQRRGDTAAQQELQQLGAPPYIGPDSRTQRERYGHWLEQYGGLWHSSARFDRVGWMLAASEYAWLEKLRFLQAAEQSFERLLPDLMRVDLQHDLPAVQIPVVFAVGRHDRMAPPEVSSAYFEALAAPHKTWVWFENSAHFPQWEEVEAFHALILRTAAQTADGP